MQCGTWQKRRRHCLHIARHVCVCVGSFVLAVGAAAATYATLLIIEYMGFCHQGAYTRHIRWSTQPAFHGKMGRFLMTSN